MKKVLSMVLVLAVMLSLCSWGVVFAEEATVRNPYVEILATDEDGVGYAKADYQDWQAREYMNKRADGELVKFYDGYPSYLRYNNVNFGGGADKLFIKGEKANAEKFTVMALVPGTAIVEMREEGTGKKLQYIPNSSDALTYVDESLYKVVRPVALNGGVKNADGYFEFEVDKTILKGKVDLLFVCVPGNSLWMNSFYFEGEGIVGPTEDNVLGLANGTMGLEINGQTDIKYDTAYATYATFTADEMITGAGVLFMPKAVMTAINATELNHGLKIGGADAAADAYLEGKTLIEDGAKLEVVAALKAIPRAFDAENTLTLVMRPYIKTAAGYVYAASATEAVIDNISDTGEVPAE